MDIDYLALLHGDLSVLDTIEDLGQAEVVGQALTNVQGWKTMSCSHQSRVVLTSKLAPDWRHKSEQPIRS